MLACLRGVVKKFCMVNPLCGGATGVICIFSVVGNANAGSGTPDWTHREAPGTMFMMIQIRSVSPSPEGLFMQEKRCVVKC